MCMIRQHICVIWAFAVLVLRDVVAESGKLNLPKRSNHGNINLKRHRRRGAEKMEITDELLRHESSMQSKSGSKFKGRGYPKSNWASRYKNGRKYKYGPHKKSNPRSYSEVSWIISSSKISNTHDKSTSANTKKGNDRNDVESNKKNHKSASNEDDDDMYMEIVYDEAGSYPPQVKCDDLNIEERATLIVTRINSVTELSVIKDSSTPQYKALAWIVNEDKKKLCPTDPFLVQRYVSALLYYSTSGDDWTKCSSKTKSQCPSDDSDVSHRWLSKEHECEWFGLACNDEGIIFAVDLHENNLNGKMPSELSELKMIKILNLRSNNLKGNIPSSIGDMERLRELHLGTNQLTGSVPKTIYGLNSLESLFLGGNNLMGTISGNVGDLTKLSELFLQDNKFTGSIPEEISELKELKSVKLQGNEFQGEMPNDICDLDLDVLEADCLTPPDPPLIQCPDGCCTTCFGQNGNSNGQAGSPSPASSPSSPVLAPSGDGICIGVSDSQRERDLLAEILKAANVKDFSNENTPQAQAAKWLISDDARQLCPGDESILQRYAAATIYYSTNGNDWSQCSANSASPCPLDNRWLSSESECFWNGVACNSDSNIETLELGAKNLQGTIPGDVAIFYELITLNLRDNKILGTIPTMIGFLGGLEVLRLDTNMITGTIPKEMYDLVELRRLDLQQNKLTSTLSSEIGKLTALRTLRLDNNLFEGPIPSNLGQLSELGTLELQSNSFTGSVPESVCNLNLLVEFVTDCASPPNPPRVSCSCCTRCESDDDRVPTAPSQPTQSPLSAPTATTPTSLPNKCGLDPEERARGIVDDILQVTELSVLSNRDTPQYEALQFIINNDTAQICPEDPTLVQRYVLSAFYFATDGSEWFGCSSASNDTACQDGEGGWLSGTESECDWFGVECSNSTDGNNFVTEISLADQNLQGTIINEIQNLTSLSTVDWSNNKLMGTIPNTMSNLQSLMFMSLENNDLTGFTSLCEGKESLVTLVVDCNNVECNDGCCTCPPGQAPESFGEASPKTFDEFLDDVVNDETLLGAMGTGNFEVLDVFNDDLQLDDDFTQKYAFSDVSVVDQNLIPSYSTPTEDEIPTTIVESEEIIISKPQTASSNPQFEVAAPASKNVGKNIGVTFGIFFLLSAIAATGFIMWRVTNDDEDDTIRWLRSRGYSAVDRIKLMRRRKKHTGVEEEIYLDEEEESEIHFYGERVVLPPPLDEDKDAQIFFERENLVLPPPDDAFFKDIRNTLAENNDDLEEEFHLEIDDDDDDEISSRASSYHSHDQTKQNWFSIEDKDSSVVSEGDSAFPPPLW